MTSMSYINRALLLAGLALPSLDLVHKYGGDAALLVYPLVIAGLLLLAERQALRLPTAAMSRWCVAVAIALLVAMVVAFLLVFPLANVHEPGHGSDTDEAYNLGVRALLEWRSPYIEPTYLGSRIHQLPGSLLLATPFVLLGNSAWQNLLWMALYTVVLIRCMGALRGTSLLLLQLAASPVLMHQIVTGSDGVMTGLSTMLAMMAVLHTWSANTSPPLFRWGSVALLALALSNRLNLVLGMIPPVMYVWRLGNRRQAAMLAAVLGSLLVVLDFALYVVDPAMYAPLNALDRASRFETLLPGSAVLIPLVGGAVTILAGWRRQQNATAWAAPLMAFGLGQGVMVVAGMALSSIDAGAFDTSYSYYACSFMLFPFCWVVWQRLTASRDFNDAR